MSLRRHYDTFDAFLRDNINFEIIKQTLKLWAEKDNQNLNNVIKMEKADSPFWIEYTLLSKLDKFEIGNRKRHETILINQKEDKFQDLDSEDSSFEYNFSIRSSYCFSAVKGFSIGNKNSILVDCGIYIGGNWKLGILTEGDGPYGSVISNYSCRILAQIVCNKYLKTENKNDLKSVIEDSINELDHQLQLKQDKYWNLQISGLSRNFFLK